MNSRAALLAALLCTSASAPADVLISQYYEGSSFNKWIELSNTGPTAVSLAGYRLTRFFNATAENWKFDGASPGFTQDLDALSIPANGFLLIAHASAAVPAYAVPDLSSGVINFNGNDSMVLYDTALGNVGDTAAIADAISFTESGNEGANKSFYRLSNAIGFNTTLGSTVLDFPAVWGTKSNAEVDDADPGDPWYLSNFASTATDELTVALSTNSIAEDGGTALVDVTVTRTGSTAVALDITVSSSDESEAVVPVANQQIPAGQASETFTMIIDAVDDPFADGTQIVTIMASAAGFTSGSAELSVTDDGDVSPIVINEVLADPVSGPAGDANNDGSTDSSEDEFVEIVNVSGADLALGGWEIHDGSSPQFGVAPRHIFFAGTILPDGCAIVVFGGGLTDALGGSSLYRVALTGALGLNNGGDTVTVFNDSGVAVAEVVFGAEGGNNESLTRDADLSGSFVGHTVASTGGGAVFSPGTLADGSLFCLADGDLSITLSGPNMNENGGSLTATITRTGDLTDQLDVVVRIDDASEAETDLTPPDLATIPAGQSSVVFTINAIDDVAPDGTQTVTISAIASGHATGLASFDVLDDGDGVFDAFVFNEVLSDPPPGSDPNRDGTPSTTRDEFVELINVSGAPFDLSGYELYDGFGQRHVFPPGSVVADGQAIVIFGGGAPNGTFGGSVVQTASSGALGLNNSGDSVTLTPPGGGSELLRYDYDGSVLDESMTRDPDLTGAFVAHSGATGAGGALFTPGTQVDGTDFSGSIAPGTFRSIGINFATNEVTIRVSGLQPVLVYSFDVSIDLGDFDSWFSILTFTTADGTEVSPGVFQFVFNDSFIPFEAEQYYRLSRP
ncbi:MAG: lamin tail domain-containing protein [Roseibacillus sp.]